jgi:thiosulfate dehydrogenase [quinone] large subunit
MATWRYAGLVPTRGDGSDEPGIAAAAAGLFGRANEAAPVAVVGTLRGDAAERDWACCSAWWLLRRSWVRSGCRPPHTFDRAQCRGAAPEPWCGGSDSSGRQDVQNAKMASATEQFLIVFFRLTMGWTFLWAAMHHFGDSAFVAGFLAHTKTFHDVYAPLTRPDLLPVFTFLVEYGHLLIGLSLISGLLVRVSAPFAIMLMLLYWSAHMDFPYIDNVNSLLVDYHIVYAGVLLYLIVARAGHVLGLDGWIARRLEVERALVPRELA